MVCDCTISINYSILYERISVDVGPLIITSEEIINGKASYTWTDVTTSINFIIYWDNETNQWGIYNETTEELLFYLPYLGDCPGDPLEEENVWFIIERQERILPLSAFSTIVNNCDQVLPIPIDPQCVAWENGTLESLPFPWNDYTFILNDFPNPESLYPGQLISELYFITFVGNYGTGEYKIGTLVYLLGTTVYNSYVVGSEFIGVLIVDSEGTIIIPSIRDINIGYVCFVEEQDTSIENNFNTCVLDKQCEFAKCVSKYLQMLQFGATCCDDLEDLKNKKRILEILNCYDTRDIENNTMDYNSISYSKIKNFLNS
jgi:hypothetical protein